MQNNFYGSFVLVLHTHIPYVLRHDPLGEEWIFDSTAECYIPLLNIFNRLIEEGVSPKVTMGLTPVLVEQLSDPYFISQFEAYCQRKIELARQDFQTFRSKNGDLAYMAKLWRHFYARTLTVFRTKYNQNIIAAFKDMQDQGHIELITSMATHCYCPLIREDTSIQAQLKLAINSYQTRFGRHPSGIWLPECGYRPRNVWRPPVKNAPEDNHAYLRKGVEEFIDENDLDYFVVSNEQLMKAYAHDNHLTPLDIYFAGGAKITKKPVTIFTRDASISEQVWNFFGGYPGDSNYLDFHKRHSNSRLRYWKTTDRNLDMSRKQPYFIPYVRDHKIAEHAGHYKWLIKESLKANYHRAGKPTLIMTAFDTELFGHWWFEGPAWLYRVIKWVSADHEINIKTCSEYRAQHSPNKYIHLHESSWGTGNNNNVWINPKNEWIWSLIYQAEKEIRYLGYEFAWRQKDHLMQRILNQCMRELLLLQSSDWGFMITNNSTKNYAEQRVAEHHENFNRLSKIAWDYGYGRWVNEGEWGFLAACENKNNIFSAPDLNWYAKLEYNP
jgi:1,4-alpha-glucan branching enzyme